MLTEKKLENILQQHLKSSNQEKEDVAGKIPERAPEWFWLFWLFKPRRSAPSSGDQKLDFILGFAIQTNHTKDNFHTKKIEALSLKKELF